MTGRSDKTAVSASPGVSGGGATGLNLGVGRGGCGTGAVRAVVGGGALAAVGSQAPVPVPPRSALTDEPALTARLRGPYLQMIARPGAVPCARHYARRLLWEQGLKELIEPVELVVSEVVTNAVRASGGLDCAGRSVAGGQPVVRLWLAAEETSVLVWDECPVLPERLCRWESGFSRYRIAGAAAVTRTSLVRALRSPGRVRCPGSGRWRG